MEKSVDFNGKEKVVEKFSNSGKISALICGISMLVGSQIGTVEQAEARRVYLEYGHRLVSQSNYDKIDNEISEIITRLSFERNPEKRQKLLDELLKFSQIKENLSKGKLNSEILGGTSLKVNFSILNKVNFENALIAMHEKRMSNTDILNYFKTNKIPYYYKKYFGFYDGIKTGNIVEIETLEGIYNMDGTLFRGYLKPGKTKKLLFVFGEDIKEYFEFYIESNFMYVKSLSSGKIKIIKKGTGYNFFSKESFHIEFGFGIKF